MDIEQDWIESLTSGADGYENITWEDLIQDETTMPIVCSCGSWTTYGKECSPLFHSDYCDLSRKDINND